MFRRSYRKNEAMDDNRELLKHKYMEGKRLGTLVNDNRNMVKDLTNKIEQIRRENAMRGLVDENGEIKKSPEEQELQAKINMLKVNYTDSYN